VSATVRKDACVLDGSVRDEFERTGMFRLDGAFSAADASRMRAVVWRELGKRYGIERDDPSTWDRHEPTGLTSTKKSAAFAPVCAPAVARALDALLGTGRWQQPKQFGNVLVTMPNAKSWRVPHQTWHSDFPPTLSADRLVAVKLWALFDDVEAGGGGTPQLAGSHALFAQYIAREREGDYKRAKFGFLNSHPWLKALTRDDGDPDRNQKFMGAGTEIDGQELRVVECTGKAGDVYVTHPWVFHTIAANASDRPRLMRSFAVWPRDAA
jgi:hypothetical protein